MINLKSTPSHENKKITATHPIKKNIQCRVKFIEIENYKLISRQKFQGLNLSNLCLNKHPVDIQE